MEPLLRPADILTAVVLPAMHAGMAAHGFSGTMDPDHSDGAAAPSRDAGSAGMRLALQLGLDGIPAVGDEHSSRAKRGSVQIASATRQSDLRSTARALAAEGTASELLRALCALLDARPTAQPSADMTGSDEPSAALRSDAPSRRVSLRLVEAAIEFLQRLVSALAELAHDVSAGLRAVPGSSPIVADPASESLTRLRRQLGDVLIVAGCCNWRTALQLAPLEAAMSSLPASAAPAGSELPDPAESRADLAVLLTPPLLRGSRGDAHTPEQHGSDSSHMRSNTAKAQQAVPACLVLCASSADAASAFVAAAHALTRPQQTAEMENLKQYGNNSHGQNTAQWHTRALTALVRQLPRKIARRALLAACLELLPWCTAAEYRRLTDIVLPAWLAALQPRAASAAATLTKANRAGGSAAVSAGSAAAASVHAGAASGGGVEATSTGVLQLSARVASLLVREDAPVPENGSGRRDLLWPPYQWRIPNLDTPLWSGTSAISHLELITGI